MIAFKQYSTNIGYIIGANGYSYSFDERFMLNGTSEYKKVPHMPQYVIIDKPLTSVQQRQQTRKQHVGFTLIDPNFGHLLNIPLHTSIEYVADSDEDDGNITTCPRGVLPQFHSLYTATFSEPIDTIIDVEFTVIDAGNYIIDNFTDITTREIRVSDTKKVTPSIDISKVCSYDEIVKILTPEFALLQSPMSLTSATMYTIVRTFVQANIDPRVARITSNYDFCFEVKKVVNTKPVTIGKTKKKLTNNETLVKVFEMTYEGYRGINGYEGYTCIPSLDGKNAQDLMDTLTDYLADIIQVINSVVTECEHCKGTGYHVTTWSKN